MPSWPSQFWIPNTWSVQIPHLQNSKIYKYTEKSHGVYFHLQIPDLQKHPDNRRCISIRPCSQVKIPSAVRVDGVTYYEVHVHPNGVEPGWRVLRRYNHFAALAKEVVAPEVSLPPKFYTKLAQRNPQNMEDRNWGKGLVVY